MGLFGNKMIEVIDSKGNKVQREKHKMNDRPHHGIIDININKLDEVDEFVGDRLNYRYIDEVLDNLSLSKGDSILYIGCYKNRIITDLISCEDDTYESLTYQHRLTHPIIIAVHKNSSKEEFEKLTKFRDELNNKY